MRSQGLEAPCRDHPHLKDLLLVRSVSVDLQSDAGLIE
jgi:hypothetical protein